MNLLPIVSLISKSLGLSISLFLVSCIMLNIKFEPKRFIKFIILPIVFLSVYFFKVNYLLNVAMYIIVVSISLKHSLSIPYKKSILLILGALCAYTLIQNLYSIILNDFGILTLILTNEVYSSSLFNTLIAFSVIAVAYTFKGAFKDYADIINVSLLNHGIYNFIIIFLSFLAWALSHFSPYHGIVNNNPYLLNNKIIITLLNLFIISTFILLHMFIKTSYSFQILKEKNKTLQDCFDNVENLNKDLRSRRHDFLNHLQVISGLLQLKKYQECFEYITGINSNSYNKDSIRTGLISINALLNSKQLRAKNKNVRMELDISTQLDSSTFSLQDWEITNILGNLIDNAIFEECKVSTLDKYVKIKISEYNSFYNFCVYNKNSYIPLDKKLKIFSSGFSTKGKDGHGMGLYIVKNIVNKYNGNIDLESNIETGTSFSISIPKKIQDSKEEKNCYPPQESLSTQIV